MVLTRVEGQDFVHCKWEDVEFVWQDISQTDYLMKAPIVHVFRVQMRDGTELKFTDNLHQVEELGRTIQQESLAPLYSQAMARLDQGQAVDFGPITVTQEGLLHEGESLSWDAIARAEMLQGHIVIRAQIARRPWRVVNAATISNVYVFLKVLADVVAEEQEP